MSEVDFSSPSPENNQQLTGQVAKVFDLFSHEQIMEADRAGSLFALIREANYDYDIDLPDPYVDALAVAGKVREVIYAGADTVRIKFGEEEQDAALEKAITEEQTILNLTPGMLRTLRERSH